MSTEALDRIQEAARNREVAGFLLGAAIIIAIDEGHTKEEIVAAQGDY